MNTKKQHTTTKTLTITKKKNIPRQQKHEIYVNMTRLMISNPHVVINFQFKNSPKTCLLIITNQFLRHTHTTFLKTPSLYRLLNLQLCT